MRLLEGPLGPDPGRLSVLLSIAELSIIRGIAAGKTQAEIGEDVHLEQSTISKTIKGIEARAGFPISRSADGASC